MKTLPRNAAPSSHRNTLGFHWMKRALCSSSVALPNTSTSTVLITFMVVTRRFHSQMMASINVIATISDTVAT